MKEWEKALSSFLEEWKDNEEVIGALVCGSYVTGNPTLHSDIDVHIILSDRVKWRSRGNVIINNYLIEYFANPPQQISKYFEEDYKDLRPHAMVQFLTGKILFDDFGAIKKLKKEAEIWMGRKYDSVNETSVKLMKYHLWDTLDNLQDCYGQNRLDFDFIYYNSLKILFEEYSKYLRCESVPFYQIVSCMRDPRYKEKYLSTGFPDEFFCDQFIGCLSSPEKELRMHGFEMLTNYVLDKMGGFDIDGWEIRSSIQ